MKYINSKEYNSPAVEVFDTIISNPIAGSNEEPGDGGNEGFGSEDI